MEQRIEQRRLEEEFDTTATCPESGSEEARWTTPNLINGGEDEATGVNAATLEIHSVSLQFKGCLFDVRQTWTRGM
jgi:hypothetical protein